jgi:glycosyltransferase involved in cell wall biosynthesis
MKFLHVVGSMNPTGGGPAQGIRNLANHMLEYGNTVEAVCLDETDSDYLSQVSFPIHTLGLGRAPWNYNPALLPWLNKNLPRFDAVIMNGLWQYQSYAVSTAAQVPGRPAYYIFPHGMLDPWFQRAPERRVKAIRNWLYWKIIEHRVLANAAAVFFTCNEEMRLARRSFRPYNPKREISVGYGVTPPPKYHIGMGKAFTEKCPGIKEKPYLLFLSRIHSKKGIDLLLESYSTICRADSGLSRSSMPHLVIAGPGLETAYGQKMQKMAVDLCPPNSVFWPGMLTGDAKWGALYNCEAFILPSHQENFGIAPVETLACGRPVLISDQVNIWREIKEDGAALVQKDTSEGTRQLLLDWIGLSAEAKTNMAAQAEACFERHFSIDYVTRKLLAAIVTSSNRQ